MSDPPELASDSVLTWKKKAGKKQRCDTKRAGLSIEFGPLRTTGSQAQRCTRAHPSLRFGEAKYEATTKHEAVENNKQVKCKCHGVSGSCEIKTCWVTAPEFRVVGDELKTKFQNAILVDQSNLGNGATQLIEETNAGRNRRAKRPGVGPAGRGRKKQRRSGSERNLDNSLLYYEKSPTFCEKDPSIDSPGTEGRQCNLTSKGHDSCASLCCGRGYTSVKKLKKERCNCKFQWCCTVSCETCLKTEWITVCQ
ncbi:unnamed protein product [Bemisia tabaci]|uniref:Protein Wnt n=1 Tax=Bemisia tabaci TaxID=7038 RepID=A0A9P0AN57_BEMTA|nr:unnamed protein product [Bemisia tabaci]